MRAFYASLKVRLPAVRVVLELFAGSCRFSRAAALAGCYVCAIDWSFGPGYDLLCPKLQACVLGWIQAGWIRYVLAAWPCRTLSRARNRPGGPPALRSAEHPLGLPHLRPAEAVAVSEGNALLAFVGRLFHSCRAAQTPVIGENPWTSWAWAIPTLAPILRWPGVHLTRSDFCQWGARWRKSTGFITMFCQPRFISKTCCGRLICTRSGKPHFRLEGKNDQGIFWTHIAEPYPRKLATELVRMAEFAHLSVAESNLDKLFCKLC